MRNISENIDSKSNRPAVGGLTSVLSAGRNTRAQNGIYTYKRPAQYKGGGRLYIKRVCVCVCVCVSCRFKIKGKTFWGLTIERENETLITSLQSIGGMYIIFVFLRLLFFFLFFFLLPDCVCVCVITLMHHGHYMGPNKQHVGPGALMLLSVSRIV